MAQRPVEPAPNFDLGGLDLLWQSPAAQAEKHVLLLLDRYTRKLYARALPNRWRQVSIPAVQEMLAEARADNPEDNEKAGRGNTVISMDKAGEFVSEEFVAALEEAGIAARLKQVLAYSLSLRAGERH